MEKKEFLIDLISTIQLQYEHMDYHPCTRYTHTDIHVNDIRYQM